MSAPARVARAAAATLGALRSDFSVSALVAGLIAVSVSFAGPAVIIFQAARAGQLSSAQLSSWICAISIGSGVCAIYLSLRFRAPVITAWSTPGAALLVAGLAQYGYAQAVGAFVFSALLLTLLGATGLFSRIMQRIPEGVVAAMLAGILLRFGMAVFGALQSLPLLVLPIVCAYLLARRWLARYAVVAALAVGLCAAFAMGRVDGHMFVLALATPVFTVPEFSLAALIGLGVPLCFVTMASQNAPGVAVLQTAGYRLPVSPLVTSTGLASLLLAPFGAHAINLAAITAAICTGPEAHANAHKRYVAGVACGVFYLLVGAFGSIVAGLFSALPEALVAAVAGLALLGALAAGLGTAMADAKRREAALVAFLLTASGVTFFGIGAPFWGLLGGVLADRLLLGAFAARPLWRKSGAAKKP